MDSAADRITGRVSSGSAPIPIGPAAPARVGVIVPHDMALDAELWRWAPPDVSLHITRQPHVSMPLTLELTIRLGADDMLADSARSLRAIAPLVCAYACTSGSFARGLTAEQAMVSTMVAAGVPQALTTSGALLVALTTLGINRLAIATPYDATITDRLASFLAEADVDVVSSSHLDLSTEIWSVPYERTADLVRRADTSDAEAIFVSCTNLPTYDVIAPLENDIGKPVLTANQVTMWQALRLVGRRCVGTDQHLIETT